jgi:hypothetical protein
MDLDCGNVRGKRKLRDVLKAICKALQILTRRSVWKSIVVKAGAIIHLPWKESTPDHDAGLWVHLHAVILTSTSSPRFQPLLDEYRRILRDFPVSAVSCGSKREVISVRDANHLGDVAGYLSHIRKRTVGYPEKSCSTWLLWEIPDQDITAYTDATKSKLRVLQREFDPDILKISRRRFHTVPPEYQVKVPVRPSATEMVATYNRLSRENHPQLTMRFLKLAEYIGEKCRPVKPCRLRACPYCLQHQLDRDSRIILSRSTDKGDRLVSLLLRLPSLPDASHLESVTASLSSAAGKFLRNSSAFPQTPSAFVFRVRARPVFVDGQTLFRLFVRMIVVVSGHIDALKLKTRWQRQLKAAGLRCRPKRGRPIVVIHTVKDLDVVASKLVGRVKTILGPIASMNPEEASAYLHVLAMRSDLFVSDDWDR